MNSAMLRICIVVINFYQQYLSFDRGLLRMLAPGGACRFSPTCSKYTKQQILKYGVGQGLKMGIRRILSCR